MKLLSKKSVFLLRANFGGKSDYKNVYKICLFKFIMTKDYLNAFNKVLKTSSPENIHEKLPIF